MFEQASKPYDVLNINLNAQYPILGDRIKTEIFVTLPIISIFLFLSNTNELIHHKEINMKWMNFSQENQVI